MNVLRTIGSWVVTEAEEEAGSSVVVVVVVVVDVCAFADAASVNASARASGYLPICSVCMGGNDGTAR